MRHFGGKHFKIRHFIMKHFRIEVVIQPTTPSSGGWLLPAEPVYIRVTVYYKDKSWTAVSEKSYLSGIGLVLTKASFIGYRTIKTKVSAVFLYINSIKEKIIIKTRNIKN